MSVQLSSVGVASVAPVAGKPSVSGSSGKTTAVQESVTLSKQSAPEALTYTDPRDKADPAATDVMQMIADANKKVDEFMTYLRAVLNDQGLAIDKVARGEQKLTVDAATIEKAKADVAEDGEFGVRKTAERILNFAKLGMGNDPAKIDTFRAAIQKGFDQAQGALGGSLPEISQQTHQAIMDELDRWAANGIPQGAVSLAAKLSEQSPASAQA